MSTTNVLSQTDSAAGEFAGQLVVVTGAGSGIGRATAKAFAKEGARLALLDVSRDGLDETVRLVGSEGHLALECDVSSPAAITSAFSQIDGVLGPVNVLINNAGINPPVKSSLDVDESYFDRVMDVNSKGIFFCAQAAMRSMIPQRKRCDRQSGLGVRLDRLGRKCGVLCFKGSCPRTHESSSH